MPIDYLLARTGSQSGLSMNILINLMPPGRDVLMCLTLPSDKTARFDLDQSPFLKIPRLPSKPFYAIAEGCPWPQPANARCLALSAVARS
ncbi:MAG: hypothetical protein H6Q05_3343 [Acidobacteria bacterium]|nr:hypothetical protein [Acidobacteriota bacterium]